MTTIIERSIFIDAAPEAIAMIANDPGRLPDWFSGVTKIEPDNNWPETWSEAIVTYKSAGISFKSTFTSLEFKSGEKLTIQLDGMLTGTNQWIYTPEGKGTLLTFRLEYNMPGGGVGQAVNKLLVERANEKNVEQSLNNLKKLVEG